MSFVKKKQREKNKDLQSFFSKRACFLYTFEDPPAVVTQSSSSLLSIQLFWPLQRKLRSTQRPFRHLKRVSEHTRGLPAVVEKGQVSKVSSLFKEGFRAKFLFKLAITEKQEIIYERPQSR